MTEANTVEKSKSHRTLVGRVLSDKMSKTRTVIVERRVTHPLYGKVLIRTRKYHVHDADNACHAGDLVMIEECRPISKSKAWRVTKLLEKVSAV
jgi:small subunit ribosomal protein S17